MARHERLGALMELLARDQAVEVERAAVELGVSTATIRRDLDTLAAQRLLTRTHGGAVPSGASFELPLRYKQGRHPAEKRRIAAAAAAMVPVGAVLGLNGGTTATEVARALALRQDLQEGAGTPALTLVTNALNIAAEIAVRPHLKTVVTGGVARPQSYELTGPLAAGVLDQLALDTAILGVDAVDPVLGVMTHQEGEAAVNRMMAARARQVIVVADASKLGRRAFARICPPPDIDVLVTDKDAPEAVTGALADAGVEIVRA